MLIDIAPVKSGKSTVLHMLPPKTTKRTRKMFEVHDDIDFTAQQSTQPDLMQPASKAKVVRQQILRPAPDFNTPSDVDQHDQAQRDLFEESVIITPVSFA